MEHTSSIRDVESGDTVHLYTTEGENFEATCTSRQCCHADPRSGEIRETHIWMFDTLKGELAVSFVEGLRSSPDDPEFPIHNEIYAMETEGTLGYVKSIYDDAVKGEYSEKPVQAGNADEIAERRNL